MDYIQVRVACDGHLAVMLIAEFGEAGFDVHGTSDGFEAYVEECRFC